MKKIAVDKGEGIAEVIDRILAVGDEEILLVIPKGSALGKSASNFRLLKREADAAEKTVFIDSSDETTVGLAKECGLESPVSHAGPVADIIPKSDDDEEEPVAKSQKKHHAVKLVVPTESASNKGGDDDEDEEGGKQDFFGNNRFFKPRPVAVKSGARELEEERGDDEDGGNKGSSKRGLFWIVGIIVILAAAFYITTVFFGHAQVTIDFTQTPWNYSGDFVANKSISTIDPASNTIPAQVFTITKNITQLFPATGAAGTVSTKAQGTITIYNDYNTASQDLVATTRFETPDGKIFRITQNVTVPGEVASGTSLVPSSIVAPIVADQGGPAYNVGPVSKLTIPGFANDPGKETGFYGVITGQTTGGFTGTKPIPTAADIADAKTKTTAILQSDLEGSLGSSYPNNFKILDGATDIQITKLTVSTSTDANGNFSVFGEATLQAVGFDQSMLETYLLSQAASDTVSSTFKSVNLSYSAVQANFSKGQVSFALSGTGNIEPAFDPNGFASSIAGMSISNARTAVSNLPALTDGKISVWPIWLWSMPSNPNKISVTAN
jgi:hypothetical protein